MPKGKLSVKSEQSCAGSKRTQMGEGCKPGLAGTLTVLAGESGTVSLCFVCVPKNTFENASINFFLKEVP